MISLTEQRTIRERLKDCRSLPAELSAIRKQIQRIDENISTGYRDALVEKVEALNEELICLENLLMKVDTPRERTILRYFYMLGWTDDQIADELNVSGEWVRKLRYACVHRLERREKVHRGWTHENAGD